MSKRNGGKQPPKSDCFAALYANDHYGTIFRSMVTSPAYNALSVGAKQFYTLCRVQAQSEEGRRCLYQQTQQTGITVEAGWFVFPAKHLTECWVDRSSASRWFKELEKRGFIECIQRGKNCFSVNVYRFSDKWKNTS